MTDQYAPAKRAANAYNSQSADRRRPYIQPMYNQDPLMQYADAEQQQMLFNMEFPPLDTGFNNAPGNSDPPTMPQGLMEMREAFPVGNLHDQFYTAFQEVSKPPQPRSGSWLEPSSDVDEADRHGQDVRQEITRLRNVVDSLTTQCKLAATLTSWLTNIRLGGHATIIDGLTTQVEQDSRRRAELTRYAEDLAKWTEKVQKHCDEAVKECRTMMKK
ncbi:hypothetical protein V493_03661 [Pseudogymnoascus sp. VKM F-4281 (FW-2241)]|nr:hypothetical protein V493_03661 [Pseudogymnoascus sp. VKM F-4281 (FW-2241)]